MGRLKCCRLVTFGTIPCVVTLTNLIFYRKNRALALEGTLKVHPVFPPYFADGEFEVSRGDMACQGHD